jgi:hypothetical protein
MSRVIVVYGGGFQPFHAGHLSSYIEAKKAFPKAAFYVAASNDTKTRPIPFNDKQFLAQQAGVDSPFVQVKAPINPTEILDRFNPNKDIFILVRSERDPVGYTKKDGSPGYFQPFVSLDKCQPFGQHGYVFVTHKKEFKLNGQVVYSGTQVRDMYADSDDQGRVNIINQLYPQSSKQRGIKQMLDKYIGSSEPTVEPNKSAITQLKAKKLKEQIQRMRPLIKEATVEQKYKMLKLIKEAAQLDELNLFKKKTDALAQKPLASDNYRAYFDKTAPATVKSTGKVYRHPDEYLNKTKIDPLTVKEEDIDEDWNKVNRQDKTSGMSRKAVKAYRRENPGSKLKTAVTTKPSKLKPGSKAAKRRKSFCARMSGNKGPMKKPNGKPTPKALALRRWNCESVEQLEELVMIAEQKVAEARSMAQQAAIAISKKKKVTSVPVNEDYVDEK